MGQEIVYCFKCQQRIVSADYAKGLAYQLDNNSCCSTCAVEVLETLPAKAKEQLLAKMFKATQQKQSQTNPALKAMPSPPAAASTRKIPLASPTTPTSSSTPLVAGIAVTVVAFILVIIVLSRNSAPAPAPPAVPEKRTSVTPPVAGPSAEEQRRSAAAKDAMQKARDFARNNPKDIHGQIRLWKEALAAAERTGYEADARRELDRSEARVKEAAAQEIADLDRKVREFTGRRDFKGAFDLVQQARSKSPAADWTLAIDGVERGIRETAARAFTELKAKAVLDRDRGAKDAVEAAKAEVDRWGLPDYVEQLKAALAPAWMPIFDGKSTAFLSSGSVKFWTVEDRAMVRTPGRQIEAGQSREEFGDGEIRFRVSIRGDVSFWSATVRQQAGACHAMFQRDVIQAMGDGEHEVVFSCRGLQVSATLDGKPVKLEIQKEVHPKGKLQFNARDGQFRLLAIDYRALP